MVMAWPHVNMVSTDILQEFLQIIFPLNLKEQVKVYLKINDLTS